MARLCHIACMLCSSAIRSYFSVLVNLVLCLFLLLFYSVYRLPCSVDGWTVDRWRQRWRHDGGVTLYRRDLLMGLWTTGGGHSPTDWWLYLTLFWLPDAACPTPTYLNSN